MENFSNLQLVLDSISNLMARSVADLYAELTVYWQVCASLGFVLLLWHLGTGQSALSSVGGFVLRVGVTLWALRYWPWVLQGVRDLAVLVGLAATGDRITMAQFLDPGAYVAMGLRSGGSLWTAFVQNMGWRTPLIGLAFLLSWVGYCLAFAYMAYRVFWWQLEVCIMAVAGMCLVPLLAFRLTSWGGSGALSYLVNMFCRFLLGALLTGGLWVTLDQLQLVALTPASLSVKGIDAVVQAAFVAAIVVWILALGFLGVQSLASTLASGVPSSVGSGSIGTALRVMAGAGAAMLAGGAAALGLGAGGARLALAGARHLASHSGGNGGGGSVPMTTALVPVGRGGALVPSFPSAANAVVNSPGVSPHPGDTRQADAPHGTAGSRVPGAWESRMSSFAGRAGQMAGRMTGQSFQHFADMSRFTGRDRGQGGVRR